MSSAGDGRGGRGRLLRRLVALVAVLTVAVAVLSAVAGRDDPDVPGTAREEGPDEWVGRDGCRGVRYADVRGPRLKYGPRRLADFPGSRTVCAAYWLPGANRVFVPQGLALDDDRIWVGGYQWNRELGLRSCTVVALDPRTGRELAFEEELYGAVPGAAARHCHHGGGLGLTEEGLWVAETRRLWLLDPEAVGTGADPVRRLWHLEEPLRGSVLLQAPGRIGLGEFRNDGRRGGIHWFAVDDVLRSGVVTLVESDPEPWQAVQLERVPGVTWLQGGTMTGDGLHLTRSHTYCGVLRLPGGRRVGALPGIEDIEFDDDGDLWALSESGARNYQHRGGRPMVPMLARFDADAYLAGPRPNCRL